MKHLWRIFTGLAIAALFSLTIAQGNPPLIIAMWSGPEFDNLRKIEPIYEAKFGQALEIEEIARDPYLQVITTSLLSGAPRWDVVYGDTAWLPALVQAGVVQSLMPFITDPNVADPNLNLAEKSTGLDATTFNGEIYGFPTEGDTTYLFYRKDLLDQAGLQVPQTWDEFLQATIALTQDTNGDGRTDVYGTTIGARGTQSAFWSFEHYFFSFGGEFLDENNQPAINNEVGIQALTFYADLRHRYMVVPPDVGSYGYTDNNIAFQQGRAAMMVQWMAAVGELADCSLSPLVCDKFGIAPVPWRLENGQLVRETGGSQWAWFIPAASTNQVAAYKFIEWITSVEGATLWALNGGIPTNTTVLTDPQVVAGSPLQHFALLAEVFPGRNLPPNTVVTNELLDIFAAAVHEAVVGTKAPQEALDEAAARMREVLAGAGLTPTS
ncbi:MAG: sugar ABC transporter substrate-binding protein [Deinococcus sp.]|nr:sugar ABC transporter substrate-binding protein [Deinococcus sp.]